MNLIQAGAVQEVAELVAKMSIECLKSAIDEFGEATWVLAGGNTPQPSYEFTAKNYRDALDWKKVWFMIGDERHVKATDPDSNWGKIETCLLNQLEINKEHKLEPIYDEDLAVMAMTYSESLKKLPKDGRGLPRLDLVWLGLGEDGHTLSLFPGHDLATQRLIRAVVDSPKLPVERITLSLETLKQVRSAIILAVGSNKAQAVSGLLANDRLLPISLAVKTIEDSGGQTCLIVDSTASALIK